jgi:hypothetical protein
MHCETVGKGSKVPRCSKCRKNKLAFVGFDFGPQVNHTINAIWSHVRLNKDSLESERHCQMIANIIGNLLVKCEELNKQQGLALLECQRECRRLKEKPQRKAKAVESA